jgi:predicted protein tyrosine phosphatase
MKFIVVGRNEIERGIVVRTPYVVISIVDPQSRPARLRRSAGFRDELSLRFHDAERGEETPLPSEVVLMTRDQAKAIWDFVLRYRDQVGTIVVHCEQGMSRSPAVAAAICKALGENEEQFFRKYAPNQYVYELLLAAALNLDGKAGIPPRDEET